MSSDNDAPKMAQKAIDWAGLVAIDTATNARPFGEEYATKLADGFRDCLGTIAALPPAPLPADVAAELAAYRALAAEANDALKDRDIAMLIGKPKPHRDAGERALIRLAALHRPAPPLTEAEQREEATDGRR